MANEIDGSRITNRRAFLKASGASLGIGLSEIGVVSADTGYPTKEIEMTIPESGERSDWIVTVPLEWYDQIIHAEKVCDTLWDAHGNSPEFVSMGLTRSEETIHGVSKSAVNVEIDTSLTKVDFVDSNHSEIKPESVGIQSSVDGVDISVIPSKGIANTCFNKRNFDRMPGGVVIESNREFGTSTCRVKKNGTFYMLTASHLWVRCDHDVHGRNAYQSGRYLGSVARYSKALDYAAIKNHSGGRIFFKTQIKKAGGRVPAANIMSEDGVRHLYSHGTTVLKVGVSTGQRRGKINKIHIHGGGPGCTDFYGFGVRFYSYKTKGQAQGDSGGPVFIMRNGKYHMISLATVGHNPTGYFYGCGNRKRVWHAGQGVAAYKIRRNGFTFNV